MKWFRRQEESEKLVPRTRVERADTPTLLSWFDNTIMGLGASFDQWRYHDGPVEEIEQHLEVLNEILYVVQSRKQERV